MSDLFVKTAVPYILSVEGGYANNQYDPGGETKYGISKAAYPELDIASLTKEQAVEIYRADYWVPTAGRIEDINPGVALVLFDYAVNSGIKPAVKKLQELLHVAQDGTIGPYTRAALMEADGNRIIIDLFAARAMFYMSLKTWPKFGLGWMRRLFTLSACVFRRSKDLSVLDEVIEKLSAIRNA